MATPDKKERNAQIRLEMDKLLGEGTKRGEVVRYLKTKYSLSERMIHIICPMDKPDPQPDLAPPATRTRLTLDDLEEGDDRISELISMEGKFRRADREVRNQNKVITILRNTLGEQQARLDLFEHLQANSSAMQVLPTQEVESEAIAIVQASDWHVGEVVHPEKVNYWNKYDPDIAEHSANLFFDRTMKLLHKEQKDVTIKKVILHIGGDMMTGHIHEELMESTAFSPNEEAQFAKHLLIGGIKHWLNEVEELIVVCSYGNHGRNDPVKKIATGAENSYEWAMYHDIARHFENEPRIKFLIPRGEWGYIDVGEYKLRFTHLDSVRYVGGVGGISIPLIKAIHNWNSAAKASMTFGGHFHQTLINDQVGFAVNNCLIGMNAYGMRFGRPTPATQNFRLLDMKRGFTVFAPIICDDGDRVQRHTSYRGMNSGWQSTNVGQGDMIVKV
jgi:hypothetical protein